MFYIIYFAVLCILITMPRRRGKRTRRFNAPVGRHDPKYKKVDILYNATSFVKRWKDTNFKSSTTDLVLDENDTPGCSTALEQEQTINESTAGIELASNSSDSDNILKVSESMPYPHSLEGFRILNLESLSSYISILTLHTVQCPHIDELSKEGKAPIKFLGEYNHHGLASFMEAKCLGCGMLFPLSSSPRLGE